VPEQAHEPTKSIEGSFRWWEFYAVRYAMGTVVGAIVFYFLCLATPVLKPLLFEATATPGTVPGATPLPSIKLDSVQLTLLAAYGLVYCYIASAPILVFHAGRFLLTLRAGGRVWAKRFLLCLTPPIVFAIVISELLT